MTEAFHKCEQQLLRVAAAMDRALREAMGEHAPPLPPLMRPSLATASSSFSFASSVAATHANRQTRESGSGSGDLLGNVDTGIRRREKWEATMKARLAPLAAAVQDSCADLHGSLELLSDFCIDERRCLAAQEAMVGETAALEERIVARYAEASREEQRLMVALRVEASRCAVGVEPVGGRSVTPDG